MKKWRAEGRARRTATAAAIVALLEDGPLSKTAIQEALGCSSFDLGHALGRCRLYGFVEIHGGTVQASAKALRMLADNRAMLDADRIAG